MAAIGASAGGLEALRALLAELPADTGFALVVVTHRHPDVEGYLDELLARATPLAVREVADDGCEIEPDHLYLPAQGRQIQVAGGRLTVLEAEPHRSPHRPIDHFFSSLAASGRGAVAVVLSGADADGAAGAREIKAAGGIVLVQDPETAGHDRMPRATMASGAADLVLPPAAIGKELARLARHPLVRSPAPGDADGDQPAVASDPSAELTDERLERALGLVFEEVGVDFFHYKRSTVQRRIHRRMAVRQVASPERYVDLLEHDLEERRQLYQDLLIHVTRFFRDPEAFQSLAETVLAERSEGEPLRVWVPGCASGEEAYSVAIALLEHLGGRDHGQPIQIFGTDLSERSVEQARAAVYPQAIEADVSPERLERFFVRTDGSYQIAKRVRELCVFARQDLTRDPPFSHLDLVVCRNVLIYLDTELQDGLLSIFHYALETGGFLLLGSSETAGPGSGFEAVDPKHRIYRKRSTGRRGVPAPVSGRFVEHGAPRATRRLRSPRSLTSRFDQALVDRFAPAAALVDADGQLLQTRGAARNYLGVPRGEASLDLFKMVPEELLHGVRTAFDEARDGGGRPVRRRGLGIAGRAGDRRVDLEVVPLAETGEPRLYLFLFQESGEEPTAEEPEAESADQPEPDGHEVRMADLERELAASRQYLRSTVQDLEAANEELQSANEEILSANEELQSTNEELETAKEELQSANEELQTVNDELLTRNEELRRANSDTVNLLASIEIAIVMVDRDLKIWRFTPRAEKSLNLIDADLGRPIGHLRSNLDVPDLEALLRDAVERIALHEREVRDRDGRWYSLRIRPYKGVDDRIEGAVLSLVDIDAVKRHQLEIQQARDYAEAILATIGHPLVVLDAELRIDRANRAFQQTFGAESPVGKRLERLVPGLFEEPAVRAALAAALAEDEPIEGREVECELGGDGRSVLRLDSRRLAGVGDREPDLLLLVLEDVTASRRAERERLAAEEARQRLEVERLRVKERSARARSEAKDRFLAVLSHELRTPLTPIVAAADRLAEDPALPAEMREPVERIRRNARLEARLIEDLLDVSSIERGLVRLRTETVDLHRVLEAVGEICADVARTCDVELTLGLEAAEHHVAGDPIRLQQVFWNLVHNGLKFTPAGGRVTVHSTNPSPAVLLVTVEDSGLGMEPGELEELFQPFVRPPGSSRYGGLGLGLSISRGLIEAHGGSIYAQSAGRGRGTMMRVELPVADPTASPGEELEESAAPELAAAAVHGRRLLLVEDDGDSALGLSELLALKGFRVRVAGSLAAAVAALAETPPPELVISDLQLPDGNGLELPGHLPADGAVKAISLSGFGSPEDVEASGRAGFARHLTKPVDLRRLLAAIDEVTAAGE